MKNCCDLLMVCHPSIYIILDSLTYHNMALECRKNILGEGRNNNMKLKLSYERLMHKLGDLMLYITTF